MPSLGSLIKMFEGQPSKTPNGQDRHTLEIPLCDIREWHAALKEARRYVSDTVGEEDMEVQTHSAALLKEIDAILAG